MSIGCNRCERTGWLNTHQLPEDVDPQNHASVERWIAAVDPTTHDVMPCDCCDGSGEHEEATIFDCM